MPSKAKGSYALHPAIQGSGHKEATVGPNTAELAPDHESGGEEADQVARPVTPSWSEEQDKTSVDGDSPVAPSTPPPPSKRKVSLPALTSSSKRPRSEQALAINGLHAELNSFTGAFHAAVAPEVNSTPERKARAVDLAQERETELDDDDMVVLLDVFRADATVADMYVRIKKDGVRKKWVQKQLNEALYK